MANFFSSAPLDYGANYIYKGYADVGNSIAGAVSQVAQQNEARKRQEMAGQQDIEQMKLRASIEEQRRLSEAERSLGAELGQYGKNPVFGPDGRIDVIASSAVLKRARDMDERVRAQTQRQDSHQFGLEADAKAYGIPVGGQRQQAPAGGPLSLGAFNGGEPIAAPFDVNAKPLEQQVEEKRRAAALAGRERYKSRGAYHKGGTFLGDAVRDEVTGAIGFMQDGQLQPIPDGAEPVTSTGLQKAIPQIAEFRKIKGELTDAEISLRNMDRFMTSREAAGQGLDILANRFSAGMKSLMGQGLNVDELATRMAQGQLQGLLGANRTNVVGGGVMTEQDALRIIQRLGGNVDAIGNIDQVKQAIGEVYSDRYKQYQDNFNFYNAAVDDYYGSKGFNRADPVKFSGNFSNDYAAQAATPTPPAPPSAMTTEQKRQRLAELKAKQGMQ